MLRDTSALTVGFVGNLLLMTSKLAAGWVAGSQALLADGVHSFTDVLSTVVGAVGSHLGAAPPDEDHPFGHGGAENIAGVVVACIMAFTGFELLRAGVGRIAGGGGRAPEMLAAWVALAAFLIKEFMHRHALREATRTNSPAIDALARDHRSDALSSLAAFVGVVLARTSNPILDPVAALIIAGFVLQIAWEVLVRNVDTLMDREPDSRELRAGLQARVDEDDEVVRLGSLRVHPVGADWHLHLDIDVPPEMTVLRSHQVAHKVEAWARELEPRVRSAQVHVEPAAAAPSDADEA